MDTTTDLRPGNLVTRKSGEGHLVITHVDHTSGTVTLVDLDSNDHGRTVQSTETFGLLYEERPRRYRHLFTPLLWVSPDGISLDTSDSYSYSYDDVLADLDAHDDPAVNDDLMLACHLLTAVDHVSDNRAPGFDAELEGHDLARWLRALADLVDAMADQADQGA